MADDLSHLDPLEEAASEGRRILIVSCNAMGDLQLEENTFPAWMLDGVSHWLEMYAEQLMQEELVEEPDEPE